MSLKITIYKIRQSAFYIIKYLVKDNSTCKQFIISIGVRGITFKEVDDKARNKINILYKESIVKFVSFQHHDNLLMLD